MRKLSNLWKAYKKQLITIVGILVGIIAFSANLVAILDFFGISSIQSVDLSVVETLTSPAVPSTGSQTLIGPTPYPVSSLDVIASDDFSSKSTNWDSYKTSESDTGYEDGKYFIDLSSNALFLSTWKKHKDFDNGVLSVDVLGPFGEGGAISQGLGFGWQKDWEGSTYAFTIDDDGNCKFLEAINGWFEREKGIVENFDSGRNFHTLMVVVRNGEVIGYVDNEFCATYNMPNYTSGYVGVVASMSGGQGKAYFDEYRIYKLP